MSNGMMSRDSGARLGELDRALDAQQPTPELAEELFAVVDLLDSQPRLRRALTDPARPAAQRSSLVHQLLGSQLGSATMAVLDAAMGMHWGSPRALPAALERQAIRAEMLVATVQGRLSTVADELFELNTLVDSHHPLREAVADRSRSIEGRRELIAGLVEGKVAPETMRLAGRAVAARERTFSLTLQHYLVLAAQVRQRTMADVTVARALSPEQTERLRTALSKKAGHDVDLHVTIDPAVIGGVRVVMGDTLIEGTVADRLADVRRQLS